MTIQAAPRRNARDKTTCARVGVSVLLASTMLVPARAAAGPPPLFTNAWLQTRSAAPSAAARGLAVSPEQALGSAQQSIRDLAFASARIRQQLAAQAIASISAAKAQGQTAGGGAVRDGLGGGGLQVSPLIGTNPQLWQNAKAPSSTTTPAGTIVTIQQTAPRAVATWQGFNVGPHTTVHFVQRDTNGTPQAGWVILNEILAGPPDPTTGGRIVTSPSRILGSIVADGTVLLIDPNGILFGPTAQVNTHALVASSLQIDPIATGTGRGALAPLSARIADFLNAQKGLLGLGSPTLGTTVGVGPLAPPDVLEGPVTVQAGALLASSSDPISPGYVLLAAPNVHNSGHIASPAGQTLLVAARSATLSLGSNAAAPQTLLAVDVGTDPNAATIPHGLEGTLTNDGIIEAGDGNITLAGFNVIQNGVLSATTGINRTGSITISATGVPANPNFSTPLNTAGPVTLGPSSLISIQPDDIAAVLPSGNPLTYPKVDITGNRIDVQSGSVLSAPGATVAISAVIGRKAPALSIDATAVIDVAGLADVVLPLSYNFITFAPRGQEFADSPLQRQGFLRGRSLTVDARVTGTRLDGLPWVGTPLADVQPYVALRGQTLGQLLTNAGTISLRSGGNLFAQPGALLDVEAGFVHFLAGTDPNTRLLGADGRVYNLASADPSIQYVGFAGTFAEQHTRWGVTDTFVNPLIAGVGIPEPAYVQGGNAGAISFSAAATDANGNPIQSTSSALVIAADLVAQREIGPRQVSTLASAGPKAASFSVSDLLGQNLLLQAAAPVVPALGFGDKVPRPTSPSDTANITEWLSLSADALSAAGFGSVSITTASRLRVAPDVTLSLAPGGGFTANAADLDIAGTLSVPGGAITLNQRLSGLTISGLLTHPAIRLRTGATLDAAGRFVNDLNLPLLLQRGDSFINGGTVALATTTNSAPAAAQASGSGIQTVLDTTGSVLLDPGSVIDVSSGGYVGPTGKTELVKATPGQPNALASRQSAYVPAGRGGSVSILTYSGAQYGSQNGPPDTPSALLTQPATVELAGEITAFGFSQDGSLTLQAPFIRIDASGIARRRGEVALAANSFREGDFASYTLTGLYGTTVADGTTLELNQRNYLIPVPQALATLPTGTRLAAALPTAMLPAYERAPVDFSLTSSTFSDIAFSGVSSDPAHYQGFITAFDSGGTLNQGAYRALALTLGARTSILGDSGSAITLGAGATGLGTQLTVAGTIAAPGGSVTLGHASDSFPDPTNPASQITIAGSGLFVAATATLSVVGVALADLQRVDRVRGAVVPGEAGVVLPGGTITLRSGGGAITVNPGAVLDVSGTGAPLQVPTFSAGVNSLIGPLTYPIARVSSDAGTLAIDAASGALFDGTLLARAGGPLAQGGTLAVVGATSAILLPTLAFPASLPPGTAYSGDTADVFLPTDRLAATGLDVVSIAQPLTIAPGTTLSAGRQIDLGGGGISLARVRDRTVLAPPNGGARGGRIAVGGETAEIQAPIVTLSGSFTSLPVPLAASDGNLRIDASVVAVTGQFELQDVGSTVIASRGDIVLGGVPTNVNPSTNLVITAGELTSAGNLTLAAAQIYAQTGVTFAVKSAGFVDPMNVAKPGTITIVRSGPSFDPALSAGSTLFLDAASIVQGGVLRAPSGTILLGFASHEPGIPSDQLGLADIPTLNVTALAGSVTSVSAAGLALPYGTTTDLVDWNYNGQVITAPPAKTVQVAGRTVLLQQGASVNLSGGGSVYAFEWVPGTGGSRNLLSNVPAPAGVAGGTAYPLYPGGQQVFAILPGPQPIVAPSDFEFQPGNFQPPRGGTAVYAYAQPGVGQAVQLAGVPGLPGGIYTLLPAEYATLPGAWRIVQQASGVTLLPGQTIVGLDGTRYAAGALATTTGSVSATTLTFALQPQSVWRPYSEYDATDANAYFASRAARLSLTVPPLPADAGHLILAAQRSLQLLAGFSFSPEPGGRPGLVDITGTNIAILGASETAPTGSVALSAIQLDALGAGSLLVGGTRTAFQGPVAPATSGVVAAATTADGTLLLPTANNILIATDAQAPLTAPELLFVTTPATRIETIRDFDGGGHTLKIPVFVANSGQITVASGSVVEASGTLAPGQPGTLVIGRLTTLPVLPASAKLSDLLTSPAANYKTAIQAYYTAAATGSGFGGLLRLSLDPQVTVDRLNATVAAPAPISIVNDIGQGGSTRVFTPPPLVGQGSVLLGGQITLRGAASLTVDASAVATLDTTALLSAPVISATAQDIVFAQAPVSGRALVIGPMTLAQVEAAQLLSLRARDAITFESSTALGLSPDSTLELGASVLRESTGGTVTVAAGTVLLDNTVGQPGSATAGSGVVSVAAGEIDFGAGVMATQGVGALRLTASRLVAGVPTVGNPTPGGLALGAADLVVAAPLVLARTGSSTTFATTGSISLAALPGTPPPFVGQEGGSVGFAGGSVTIGTAVAAPAGSLRARATTGDVTVGAGAALSATGSAVQFYDLLATADGGLVELSSLTGSVRVLAGGTIDVSGSPAGGDAGTLFVAAPVGQALLDGTLRGFAARGRTGGSASISTGGSLALDPLVRTLQAGGLTGSVALRSGAGDLVLSGTLTSRAVTLVADAGGVVVAGTIDATGAEGGSIGLYGYTGVTVVGSLLAVGTDPNQLGGTITIATALQTTPADAVIGHGSIDVAAGARLDVSGGTRGGASGGTVLIAAPFLDNSVPVTVAGIVHGSRSTVIEGFRTYFAGQTYTDPVAGSTTPTITWDGLIDPAGYYAPDGSRVAGNYYDSLNILVAPGSDPNPLPTWVFEPVAPDVAHINFFKDIVASYVAADYSAVAAPFVGIPNGHYRPGVVLANDQPSIHAGGISVLTNLNLGAGTAAPSPAGIPRLVFRTAQGEPGILTLRATGDVTVQASISDGFFTTTPSSLVGTPKQEAASFGASVSNLNALNASALYADNGLFFAAPGDYAVRRGGGLAQNTAFTPGYVEAYSSYTTLASEFVQLVQQTVARLPYGTIGGSGYPQDFSAPLTDANLDAFRAWSSTTIATYNAALAPHGLLAANFAAERSLFSQYPATRSVPLPIPPTAPTTGAGYAAYVTAYQTYLAQVATLNAIIAGQPDALLGPFSQLVPLAPAGPVADSYSSYTTPRFGTLADQSNAIGNQPTPLGLNPVSGAALAPLALGDSWSVSVVAGAGQHTANPLGTALLAPGASTGSVLFAGAQTLELSPGVASPVPEVLRVGTGALAVAAGNNIAITDPNAPAVIYTAGHNAASYTASVTSFGKAGVPRNPAGFVPPPGQAYFAENGGPVTLAAGNDVVGQTVSLFSIYYADKSGLSVVGEDYAKWLLTQGAQSTTRPGLYATQPSPAPQTPPQPAWWVDYGTFDAGVLATGGDVRVSAGGSITDFSVSIPQTGWVTGGLTPGSRASLHVVGAGNLTVSAGGDIRGGSFYVGSGTAALRAGGVFGPDGAALSPTLGIQDSTFAVTAGRGVAVADLVNPTTLGFPTQFFTYGTRAGATLTALGGDILIGTALPQRIQYGGLIPLTGAPYSDLVLVAPPVLRAIALSGSIRNEPYGTTLAVAPNQINLVLYPTPASTLDLLAADTIASEPVQMPDTSALYLPRPLTPYQQQPASMSGMADFGAAGVTPFGDQTPQQYYSSTPLHLYDPTSNHIYSLIGDITSSPLFSATTFMLAKPTEIIAGRDLLGVTFSGLNPAAGDVTRIVAQRDIGPNLAGQAAASATGGSIVTSFTLSGDGLLDVEAGRNLGPLGGNAFTSTPSAGGILAVGNNLDPYLPQRSAAITAAFGVAPGIDYAAFATAYVDPTVPGNQSAQNASALIGFVDDQLSRRKTGLSRTSRRVIVAEPSASAAWSAFLTLDPAEQHAFLNQVFFTQLTLGVSNAPPSYLAGYRAIGVLFPAAYGYTENNISGSGRLGAIVQRVTGSLDLRGATIQTQQGGDIAILGPGGGITVGSIVAPPANVPPANQGVITFQKGGVDIFTDQSTEVNQSRVFTEQGGNVILWSSNGDLNAGRGAKTSVALPSVQYLCTQDGYCVIDPNAEVTGAGIATFAPPGQNSGGDVTLVAPVGIVDAGDAGIRSAGNLVVAALTVANADNIQVGGKTIGIAVPPTVNTAAALAASSAAGSAEAAATASASAGPKRADSVITVEVLGFGEGGATQPGPASSQDQQANGPVQVIGVGALAAQGEASGR